jgi:hypothetical protein
MIRFIGRARKDSSPVKEDLKLWLAKTPVNNLMVVPLLPQSSE